MQLRSILAMRGVALIATLHGMARRAVNAIGLGFRPSFKIGGKTVTRPELHVTIAQERAFDEVGRRLMVGTEAAVLREFTDWRLRQSGRASMSCPIGAWHDALRTFEKAGVIVPRWELVLLHRGERIVPNWDANGDPLPDAGLRRPTFDDTTKRSMFGTHYAVSANEDVGDESPQTFVTLSEEHFARVYVRKPVVREAVIDEVFSPDDARPAESQTVESLTGADDTHDVRRRTHIGVRPNPRTLRVRADEFSNGAPLDHPHVGEDDSPFASVGDAGDAAANAELNEPGVPVERAAASGASEPDIGK